MQRRRAAAQKNRFDLEHNRLKLFINLFNPMIHSRHIETITGATRYLAEQETQHRVDFAHDGTHDHLSNRLEESGAEHLGLHIVKLGSDVGHIFHAVRDTCGLWVVRGSRRTDRGAMRVNLGVTRRFQVLIQLRLPEFTERTLHQPDFRKRITN